MKVLVIEDEPEIRAIFVKFLDLLGYEADVAVNGRDGLARFDPLIHTIVVTDFLMPGLTGLEIAEAIRARSGTTPIVIISGSGDHHAERRAALAGLRYLCKPVDFAQFEATMAEVVGQAGAARWGNVPGIEKGALDLSEVVVVAPSPAYPLNHALPDTHERRCPACQSERIVHAGHVITTGGMPERSIGARRGTSRSAQRRAAEEALTIQTATRLTCLRFLFAFAVSGFLVVRWCCW
jgi:DNA-binding response OmpR family regulator